jgi:hypothetical protein
MQPLRSRGCNDLVVVATLTRVRRWRTLLR